MQYDCWFMLLFMTCHESQRLRSHGSIGRTSRRSGPEWHAVDMPNAYARRWAVNAAENGTKVQGHSAFSRFFWPFSGLLVAVVHAWYIWGPEKTMKNIEKPVVDSLCDVMKEASSSKKAPPSSSGRCSVGPNFSIVLWSFFGCPQFGSFRLEDNTVEEFHPIIRNVHLCHKARTQNII